jgi:hypothetical protein
LRLRVQKTTATEISEDELRPRWSKLAENRLLLRRDRRSRIKGSLGKGDVREMTNVDGGDDGVMVRSISRCVCVVLREMLLLFSLALE